MQTGASLIRGLSLTASFGAHAGIAAWLLLAPAPSSLPEQRIVDVELVRASVPQTEALASPATLPPVEHPSEAPPLPIAKDGMLKASAPKATTPPAAQAQATTGKTAPEATLTVAALTYASREATPLHNPAPAYPSLARKRGHEGTVLLRVDVTPQGTAAAVNVVESSGYAALDNAAVETVRDWRFLPAEQNGATTTSSLRLPIVFRLD